MKCDKCRFEHCESNECYTEYYCEIFGEDVPDEFATYDGCNLRFNEAKKFCELINECMGKYYESLFKYYGIEELTKEQQADLDRIKKEYSLASKKLKDYQDILFSRRKRG